MNHASLCRHPSAKREVGNMDAKVQRVHDDIIQSFLADERVEMKIEESRAKQFAVDNPVPARQHTILSYFQTNESSSGMYPLRNLFFRRPPEQTLSLLPLHEIAVPRSHTSALHLGPRTRQISRVTEPDEALTSTYITRQSLFDNQRIFMTSGPVNNQITVPRFDSRVANVNVNFYLGGPSRYGQTAIHDEFPMDGNSDSSDANEQQRRKDTRIETMRELGTEDEGMEPDTLVAPSEGLDSISNISNDTETSRDLEEARIGTFEYFWNYHCLIYAKVAMWCYYAGTAMLLVSIADFMYGTYSITYGSYRGAWVAVAFLGFSLVCGLSLAFFMKDVPDDGDDGDADYEIFS